MYQYRTGETITREVESHSNLSRNSDSDLSLSLGVQNRDRSFEDYRL
ncbi:MAG: hypothetical protein RID53_33960 [Coleofasciculus sp. B1-GNL1-01]